MRRLEATGTYTDDEINRLARGGKQRGQIAGVGRVLPAWATASSSTPAHESTLNSPHKKVDFMMSLFKSDSKYSDMFSQFESGGASGSGGWGDEEEGADHQDDEDEDGDGDTYIRADRFWKRSGKKITIQGSDVAVKTEGRESYKKDPKVEDPAPKATIAIDGIGWDLSYMAEEDEASKNHALVADEEELLTEYALTTKSSSSLDNEVYDDSFCSKSCRKNTENINTKISKLNEELSNCETNLYNYKIGAANVGWLPDDWEERGTRTCCGFQTFSGQQQELCDLWDRLTADPVALE
nr:F-box domain, leucine-rich repeat domain, L domain-like protein [Tanacetum cinerariifolium]